MRSAYQVFLDAIKREPETFEGLAPIYSWWFGEQKKEYLKMRPQVKLIDGYFANNQERQNFYNWLNAKYSS